MPWPRSRIGASKLGAIQTVYVAKFAIRSSLLDFRLPLANGWPSARVPGATKGLAMQGIDETASTSTGMASLAKLLPTFDNEREAVRARLLVADFGRTGQRFR